LGREHAYGPFYHIRQHELNFIIAATIPAFHFGP
jgi:hypothetical protein